MKANRQKIVTYSGIALLLGIGAYILINRDKKKKQIQYINDVLDAKVSDPNAGVGQKILNKTELSKLPVGSFPIKFGSAPSQKMFAVQQALNKNFGSNIDLDGKYGESSFVTLCSKLWNTGWTTSRTKDCFEYSLTSAPVRRAITQEDYNKILNAK